MKALLKRLLLRHAPEIVLKEAQKINKALRRHRLKNRQKSGGYTREDLVRDLRKTGVIEGDTLLVHSSLGKIGYVEGGATTVIEALLEVLGPQGTLAMPTFPARGRNKDYLEGHPVFDVRNTPSAMGLITETFRKMPGVERSLHPTDPVCARGPLAALLTGTHFGQPTPYNESSPFRKLAECGGKILMLGTTLNGACTSLHILEDAVDFPYPVYDGKIYDTEVIDTEGRHLRMKTKVHDPEWSARRDCDLLKPAFMEAGILSDGYIGEAPSMLIDAEGLFKTMLSDFRARGVTMYTPKGTK